MPAAISPPISAGRTECMAGTELPHRTGREGLTRLRVGEDKEGNVLMTAQWLSKKAWSGHGRGKAVAQLPEFSITEQGRVRRGSGSSSRSL